MAAYHPSFQQKIIKHPDTYSNKFSNYSKVIRTVAAYHPFYSAKD